MNHEADVKGYAGGTYIVGFNAMTYPLRLAYTCLTQSNVHT